MRTVQMWRVGYSERKKVHTVNAANLWPVRWRRIEALDGSEVYIVAEDLHPGLVEEMWRQEAEIERRKAPLNYIDIRPAPSALFVAEPEPLAWEGELVSKRVATMDEGGRTEAGAWVLCAREGADETR